MRGYADFSVETKFFFLVGTRATILASPKISVPILILQSTPHNIFMVYYRRPYDLWAMLLFGVLRRTHMT
jgi:hypothetical protein